MASTFTVASAICLVEKDGQKYLSTVDAPAGASAAGSDSLVGVPIVLNLAPPQGGSWPGARSGSGTDRFCPTHCYRLSSPPIIKRFACPTHRAGDYFLESAGLSGRGAGGRERQPAAPLEIARDFSQHPYVKALHVEGHGGQGLAVKYGMQQATGDYRFICDADLSVPIKDELFRPPPSCP